MKDKKSIVIFSGYFYPHLGGIERYIDNLSRELLLLGYNPIIVTSNHDNSEDIIDYSGVTVIKLPLFKIFSQRYPIPKKNKKTKTLLNKLNEYNIEAIIVNTRFHLNSHIGASYGKKHNIPVYLIEHGSNYVTLDNKFIDFFANRYEDFLTWKIKSKIKGFYGVSNACSEWLNNFGIKASGVWYNSIDTKQNIGKRTKNKEFNFLYAGRLIKQKGVENILDAFKKLEKKYNNINLYIAGDGPEYEDYIKKYNDDKIQFLGKLDFNELSKYYLKSNVFLYPPLWPEGLPTSILEAGLFGCAVIGTDQGGIKEIIKNDYNGIIVSGTSESLYKAMEELIIDSKKAKLLSSNLYDTINNKFSWESTAKKIISDINEKK